MIMSQNYETGRDTKMSPEKIKVLLSGLVLVCLLLGSYVKPVSGDSQSISEKLADSAKESSSAEKLMVGNRPGEKTTKDFLPQR